MISPCTTEKVEEYLRANMLLAFLPAGLQFPHSLTLECAERMGLCHKALKHIGPGAACSKVCLCWRILLKSSC